MRRLAICALVSVLCGCTWIKETGAQFCAGPVDKVKMGVQAMGKAGGAIPVAGPVIEIGSWALGLGMDCFCFLIRRTTAAPADLSNEGLALIGVGSAGDASSSAGSPGAAAKPDAVDPDPSGAGCNPPRAGG